MFFRFGGSLKMCPYLLITLYVLPVLVPNCERVDGTSTKLWMRCGAAYTKRGIEKPFPGTQMCAQARNNEYKLNKGTKNVSST